MGGEVVLAGEPTDVADLAQEPGRQHRPHPEQLDQAGVGLGDRGLDADLDGGDGLLQLADVGDQLAKALAAQHAVAGGHAVIGEVDVHRVHPDRAGAAQVVERAVARDAIQPGAHVDLALVGEDGVEGGGENLLQHVLGVLARAQHVADEGEQPCLVARAQRLEGRVLPAACQRDEPLVGLQPQQGRGPAQPGQRGPMCK
jgi:hypothetical protein